MLGFRVRSRRLRRRSRPQANQLVCRGMTVWGGKTAPKHLFLYPVDNISARFIFPSVLPHREGRSRSSRSRGGMRWTPEMRRHAVHGERLSSGRTDLRQHCHWQGDGRPWDGKSPGQCDGRPNQNAFGQVLCGYPVPPPWDINFGDGTVRHGRCAGNRKNTACGTSGTCSAPPKVLMHSQLRKTASHQAQGCNGHLAFRTPSHKGAGMQKTTAPPRRKQWGR
jgi:hypothetical protein